MKTLKKVLAFVLVAALMLALLAACAKDNTPNTDTNKPADTNTNTDTNNNASTGKEIEELTTIKVVLFDFNSKGGDHGDRIEKAVNALTVPAINVETDITFMSMGDFASKLQVSIAGGERIDVVTSSIMNSASTLYQAGMLLDVTEQMQEYAPNALAVVGDSVACYTYGGRIYGLPTHRNLLSVRFIVMNKEVLDELNLTEKAENMTTWSEFEEIMKVVKEEKNGTGMYPIISNSGSVFQGALFTGDSLDTEAYDTLTDGAGVVYGDQQGKVSLLPGQESWINSKKVAASWNEKGYVYPDSIINTTLSGNDLMNQGITFSLICTSEYGIESSGNYKFPVVAKQINQPMLTTTMLTNWGMAVPITCEEPEAACKFLDMMYTDAKLMNVLVYGEEGTDYTIEDGQVATTETGYRGGNFIMGNNLLLTPAMGQGADFNAVVTEKMNAMPNSVYLGFTIDTAELEMYVSQMSAVNDQYSASLNGGAYTDDLYNEYMGKLKTAGVEEYLKAVQTQVDAWLAAK